jgi:hypothetical protein
MGRYKDPYKNNKKVKGGNDIIEALFKLTWWFIVLLVTGIVELSSYLYKLYQNRKK